MKLKRGGNTKVAGKTRALTELRAGSKVYKTWTCPECGHQEKLTEDATATGFDVYLQLQREWALLMRPISAHLKQHTLDDVRAGRVRIEDAGNGHIRYVPVEAPTV